MTRIFATFAALLSATAAAANPIVLEGVVPADADFAEVPFEVAPGTAELHIAHETLEAGAVLDWGLFSPDGFRGYGGGNSEPMVVGVRASSRSYLTGPLTPGTWKVYAGKAKSASKVPNFRVTVTARMTATLSDEPWRAAYAPVPPLKTGARWYAGDLHTHSRESGDAEPAIDAMALFARSRGLDFIELSEHNTTSQLQLMNAVQARSPELLLVPGVELTTYGGHANGIGATAWVDHRVGFGGVTSDDIAAKLVAQGAVFSINHPVIDVGDLCIGCKWRHRLPREQLGAVEIGTGGWDESGLLFTRDAIAFWDRAVAAGLHVAAVGGSDDHRAGVNTSSPIGNPTTMVWADALSVDAIVEGIRRGRTVVKLQGPADPMVELRAGDARIGDTVAAERVTVTATVTSGQGAQLRWVVNGVAEPPSDVTGDPFELSREVTAESRVRAEVMVGGFPRTITSHLWVTAPPPPRGCGCHSGAGALALAALALLNPRRAPRRQRARRL